MTGEVITAITGSKSLKKQNEFPRGYPHRAAGALGE
jgi:hypothetical protein